MKSIFKNIITWILTIRAKKILVTNHHIIFLVIGGAHRSVFKDVLADQLAHAGRRVVSNKPGYNYKLGCALTILGLEGGFSSPIKWIQNVFKKNSNGQVTDVFVQEFSFGDSRGDGEYVSRLLSPEVIVISDAEIAQGIKGIEIEQYHKELVEYIHNLQESVIVYVPYSNAFSLSIKDSKATIIRYGKKDDADIQLKKVVEGIDFQQATVVIDGKERQIVLNAFGDHYIYPHVIAEHAMLLLQTHVKAEETTKPL